MVNECIRRGLGLWKEEPRRVGTYHVNLHLVEVDCFQNCFQTHGEARW